MSALGCSIKGLWVGVYVCMCEYVGGNLGVRGCVRARVSVCGADGGWLVENLLINSYYRQSGYFKKQFIPLNTFHCI